MRENGRAMITECESEHPTVKPTRMPSRDKLRSLAKWCVILAGIAVAILLMIGRELAERRAVQHMPEGERRALLFRTLENLKAVCASPEDALRDFCGEQARFVLEFLECDQPCQDLAGRQLSRVQPPR
jgi:hypothetical protein